MTGICEDDKLLASRYVDGELGEVEHAAFEARLSAEPDLRAVVEDLRDTNQWFESGRDATPPSPSEGFYARVLREARRLPRAEDLAPESAPAALVSFESFCRRIMVAAVLLMAFGLLVFGGLLHSADSGELEASPADIRQKMEELDARILDDRFGDGK